MRMNGIYEWGCGKDAMPEWVVRKSGVWCLLTYKLRGGLEMVAPMLRAVVGLQGRIFCALPQYCMNTPKICGFELFALSRGAWVLTRIHS